MKVANATTYFEHILSDNDLIILDKYGDDGILKALAIYRKKLNTGISKYDRYVISNEIKKLERLLKLMTWRLCRSDDDIPYMQLGYARNSLWDNIY